MNKKPLAFTIGVVAVCYAGLVLPACSSDEEDDASTAGTGGSGATGTGGASTGGTGTGTGGSGTGGSASTTVTCGSLTCQSASTFVPACCAGTARDKCGVQLPGGGGCQEENQPGDPDQSCTDAFTVALDGGMAAGGGAGAPNFQIEGCCRPEGVCGILINTAGLNLGCVDVSQYADGGTIPTCTP